MFGALALPAHGSQIDNVTPIVSAASPSDSVLLSPSAMNQTTTATIVRDGTPYTYHTSAATVGEFLAERNVRLGRGDTVAPSTSEHLTDGMSIEIRNAVPVSLTVGSHTRVVHVVPTTVRRLLATQHVRFGTHDEISPALERVVDANDHVRVVHVAIWTAHVRQNIAARVRTRNDATLAVGKIVTLAKGRAGIRETTFRYVRRGNGKPVRVTLASRIVRQPQTRVIVRGIASYASLAHVAEQGFTNAVNIAGRAIHMIATAYTAGCYGCSGITASGVRAGFGVIAVDPRVIPLGTKLFVPGYGRAVAGDTGGAILGNRIDLGMNTQHEALQFGRRPITVYVLR